jgi:hypothetical protein
LSVTRSLLAALALLSLSACVPGFFGTPVPPPGAAQHKSAEPVLAPPPAQAAKPRPRPAAQQSAVPQPAGAPAPVTEARLATPPDKRAVIGHSEDETEILLGKPLRVTEEASAKVWHYQSSECALDVTFFFDVIRGKFFALDVTPITGEVSRCLSKLEDHAAS